MKKPLLLLSFFILLLYTSSLGQKIQLERVEPAFWWTDMQYSDIQLLVYGENIGFAKPSLEHEGVVLKEVLSVENPNYLFVNLSIAPTAKVGKFVINFKFGKQSKTFEYELKARKKDTKRHQGFDASDVMYLLMPDRFANANPENDEVAGMLEGINREDQYGRHGGDLEGVLKHLDYFEELGVTALWLNPALENNMPKQSYHGYAITDFYKVDSRLGTNEQYVEIVERCHQKGMKVIMDMVANHCGTNHWFIKDLPMPNWIHQFPEFTRSNYRGVTNVDPYRSNHDHSLMQKGWFDTTMADLDQSNPLLAKYLIQNTLWWIEYSGIDGIRMDTYSYPYKGFLAEWAMAIFKEYPKFNIVGEVWEYKATTQGFWLSGANRPESYDSNIISITDFVLKQAIELALNEKDGWDKGLSRIYYTLTQDRIYPNANAQVTFLDNHDVPRFASSMNGSIQKQKMGIATLLTLRGVPQIYYGTEFAYQGISHGEVRPEFQGGWEDHTQNHFKKEGRSDQENDLFDYTKTILNWRKNKSVVHFGKLMHFVPQDGVYVYFRYTETESVMVILNNHDNLGKTIKTARFAERLKGYSFAKDIIHNTKINDLGQITIPAKSALILELGK